MYNQSWGFWLSAFGPYYTPVHFKYGYTNPVALAAAGTQQFSIIAAGNATIAICGIKSIGATAAFAAVTGDFTLRIAIENNELENQAIDSMLYGSNIWTTAGGFALMETFTFPYFVDPGGTINGTIVNGALANNFVHLVFDCVKLYPRDDVPLAKTMKPLDLLAAMSYRQARTLSDLDKIGRP